MTSTLLQSIEPEQALLFLPLRTQYTDGLGNRVTPNLGRATGFPATVQMGNGVTATTFPTQLAAGASMVYPLGVSFDGGDYMQVLNSGAGSAFDFTGSASFTLACMIKFGAIAGEQTLFAHSDTSTNGYLVRVPAASVARIDVFTFGTGYVACATNVGAIMRGKWFSLAVVFNGATRTVRLYLDGLDVSNPAGQYPTNGLVSNNANLFIGCRQSLSSPIAAGGNMLFPCVYPFALGDAQIRSLHRLFQGWRRLP